MNLNAVTVKLDHMDPTALSIAGAAAKQAVEIQASDSESSVVASRQ
jgi:hypothetical protein